MMQQLGRWYVRYFNNRYERTGTLYEGRFKSSVVQSSEYFLTCQRYIEMNPVRAGMVEAPADYSWSSYRAHALGCEVRMWTPHDEYLALGRTKTARLDAYRGLFTQPQSPKVVSKIRTATRTGFAFGNKQFRQELERKTGQRQFLRKRGPRAKAEELPNQEFLL